MYIPLGILEPPHTDRADNEQKPFFSDLDRPRKGEIVHAVLTGQLPPSSAEFDPVAETSFASWFRWVNPW